MSAFLTHLMYDNRTNKEALKKIPGGVTWDFFRGSFRQNNVP